MHLAPQAFWQFLAGMLAGVSALWLSFFLLSWPWWACLLAGAGVYQLSCWGLVAASRLLARTRR